MTPYKISICNVVWCKFSFFSVNVIHNLSSLNHFFNQGDWQGNLTLCEMRIYTSQCFNVIPILNVKELLGLQQQEFPNFSLTAISKRKNIFIVDAYRDIILSFENTTSNLKHVQQNSLFAQNDKCWWFCRHLLFFNLIWSM